MIPAQRAGVKSPTIGEPSLLLALVGRFRIWCGAFAARAGDSDGQLLRYRGRPIN
jgi:hypothetical protein